MVKPDSILSISSSSKTYSSDSRSDFSVNIYSSSLKKCLKNITLNVHFRIIQESLLQTRLLVLVVSVHSVMRCLVSFGSHIIRVTPRLLYCCRILGSCRTLLLIGRSLCLTCNQHPVWQLPILPMQVWQRWPG